MALVCVGGAFAQSAAAARKIAPPQILTLTASVKTVPANGGAVRLNARVAGVSRCTFTGLGAAFAPTARVVTVGCRAGHAAVTVHVVPNTLTRAGVVRIRLKAIGSGKSVLRTITLKQAAAAGASNGSLPPTTPLQITTTALGGATVGTAYAGTLAATGGTAPYVWSLDSGSLPQGIALAQNGGLSGSPIRAGQFAFVARVTDAEARTLTVSLSISVTAVTVRVAPSQQSTNWSGYSLDGGPFTRATGTFNVPTLTNTFGSASDSEWVGIDGDQPGNEDLIQAGVAEDFSSFGGLDIYAWWEILPAPETRIRTMTVQPGDSITVTIAQVSAGSWSISVVDNTTGQSFSTTQSYSGGGTSAEWIVEAPTVSSGRIASLGPYTPNVTFTNMAWAGAATVFNPISLTQRGGTVSVPSPLSADQTSFTAAYGSTVPPVPTP